MAHALQAARASAVVLATDAKMRILPNGWTVISVGLLLKQPDCRTTFARLGRQARPVQGKGTVTRFVPCLQAITHSENADA